MGLAFQMLGLVESHAVFACYPLVVAALSGPVLGERVGWRRWSAIAIGFVGVLVILQPGYGVLSPWAGLPMAAAMLFALYSLLTRRVARYDSAATSFFWTAIVGAICMTLTGLSTWQPIPPAAWGGLLALCLLAVLGHYMLIQSYAQAEASTVQPFAYFQLPFASLVGVLAFGEAIPAHVALGAGIVVSAGLFTLWRTRQQG